MAKEYELEHKFIWIDYTNHKGARRLRRVMPLKLVFGATPYHSPQQWLLECVDIEDGHKIKMFALSGMHAINASKEALEKISSPGFQPTNAVGSDSLSLGQQLSAVCNVALGPPKVDAPPVPQ